MEEKLNYAIPASSLIKTLAQQRRDLELENLELRREIEILKEDNKALKEFSAEVQYSSQAKDITKITNAMLQLWSQIAKKIEPLNELCDKTEELKGEIDKFIKTIEK